MRKVSTERYPLFRSCRVRIEKIELLLQDYRSLRLGKILYKDEE